MVGCGIELHLFSLSVSSPDQLISKGLQHAETFFLPDKRRNLKALCRKGESREIPLVAGSTMDEIYDILAAKVISSTSYPNARVQNRLIVGLAGPPGAGKSTIASEVVNRVNKLCPESVHEKDAEVAVVLPMDGFHLYRSQLDAMEDPEEAHARRGAPWTFAPELLLNCLKKLREGSSVSAPSFCHGIGDPIEDDVIIGENQKVVIVEGNYLLLDDDVWRDISRLFDQRWFVEVDIDSAMSRVLKRHISTGKSPDIATWRIHYNDRPNAKLIMKSKKNADLVIRSVEIKMPR